MSKPIDHSPAAILLAYLASQALVTPYNEKAEWPGTVAALADNDGDHSNALAVMDTPGVLDGRAGGETIEHYGIQLRVRGVDYSTGDRRARRLAQVLDSITRAVVTLEGHQYRIQGATITTPVVHLGPEEFNYREHFTLNAILTIVQLA